MKIGFVGFGNMASAMADGWIAAGVAAGDMCACAGRYDALVERCEARGMAACHDAAEVVAASDIVVAAVKPYMIEKVFAPLKDALADKVVLSVAWTWDSAKWEQVLPGVAHISTVPNTPVSVGEGVIACEKASTLSGEQRATVLDLLGKLGTVVELDSSLLFVGGTVGGCAPAFVAMAIEALGDAAVKHGIPRADAYRIVSQMVPSSRPSTLLSSKLTNKGQVYFGRVFLQFCTLSKKRPATGSIPVAGRLRLPR